MRPRDSFQCNKCGKTSHTYEDAANCCPSVKKLYVCSKCNIPFSDFLQAANCCCKEYREEIIRKCQAIRLESLETDQLEDMLAISLRSTESLRSQRNDFIKEQNISNLSKLGFL